LNLNKFKNTGYNTGVICIKCNNIKGILIILMILIAKKQ